MLYNRGGKGMKRTPQNDTKQDPPPSRRLPGMKGGFNSYDNFDVAEVHEGYSGDPDEAMEIYMYSGDGDPADSFLGLGNKRKKAEKKQRKAQKQLAKGHVKKAEKKARKATKLASKVATAAQAVSDSGTSIEGMKQAVTAAQTQATQANATAPVAYDPLSATPTATPTSSPSGGGGGGGGDYVPDYGSSYADTSTEESPDMEQEPNYTGYNPDDEETDISYETDAPEDTTEQDEGFDPLGFLFGDGDNFGGSDEPTGKLAETKTLSPVVVRSHKSKKPLIVVGLVLVAVYFLTK